MAVERRTELGEAGVELRQHAEAEEAVRGDVLVAADTPGEGAAIAAREQEQRQAIGDLLPDEISGQRTLQRLSRPWISNQQVKARLDIGDAMNEQAEMNPRVPPQHVPW